MKLSVWCVFSLALLSTLSSAGENNQKGWSNQTGNDMFPSCTAAIDNNKDVSRDRGASPLECLQYVAGYLDGYSAGGSGGRTVVLCYPENTNTGQIVRVFVKWMSDHPKNLNEPLAKCMLNALSDAYACRVP